jgi:hypothetical protein
MDAILRTVSDWHTALNQGDLERLLALVHPEVEIGGPRGLTRGAQVMAEWVGRANVALIPLRAFQRGERVVVEERGEWRSPETGAVVGSQVVATLFVVAAGLITRVVRYDDLASALEAAGITWEDETKLDSSTSQ